MNKKSQPIGRFPIVIEKIVRSDDLEENGWYDRFDRFSRL
jgi:hypothetical protein